MNALLSGLLPGSSPLARERPAVAKLNYSHEAMVDLIISNPGISQNEIAARFGYTASWISTIMCSDVFQAKLAERRDELVDPEIRASLKLQFEGLLARSIEILRAKLDKDPELVSDQLALQTAKISSQSIGMGAPKVSVHETHVHLEELGGNLVGLLRRRRAEAEQSVVATQPAGVPPGGTIPPRPSGPA